MKLATLDLENSRYTNNSYEKFITLTEFGSRTFDSFHNSFFESYWIKYTNLKKAYYSLNVKGTGRIELIRDEVEKTEIISQINFDSEQWQRYDIPFDLKNRERSRIYLKIHSNNQVTIENSISIESDQKSSKEVNLAIIMCTFNKQDYIRRNLNDLLNSEDFKKSSAHVFVVDNASNLNISISERVHYFSQGNFGGAGGFTRGLIEAKALSIFSHYLFMDDDIELDPDMITRTIAFHAYSNRDYGLCGGMLALDKKNTVWELGGDFFNGKLSGSPSPHFNDLNLDNELLNKMTSPYNFEYGAWWYFCFSDNALNKVGLPLPFFIRGDDIEYGLRLKASGFPNISLPGISVWHETFVSKTAPWLMYFRFRNYFIIGLLYGTIINNYKQSLKFIANTFGNILTYDYKYAAIQIKALSDVIRGSKDIGSLSSPSYKNEITEQLKVYSPALKNEIPNYMYELPRGNLLAYATRLITLNSHLLPKTSDIISIEYSNWKRRILLSEFKNANILVHNKELNTTLIYYKSLKKFLELALKLTLLSILLLLSLPILVILYRGQQKKYSDQESWRKFLMN